MEFLTEEAWQIAADLLLTTVLLKAGLLTGVLWLAVRLVPPRHSDLRAGLWVLGFGALFLLPLVGLTASRPLVDVQLVQFPQGIFQGGGSSSPAFWLALVWAGGSVVLLLRFVLHRLRIARVATSAEPVDDGRLAELLAEAGRRVGVQRRVRLAFTDGAASPILVGWLRPVVLLAPEAGEWPEDRLLAVLCHELGHVQRGDYLWMVVGEIVRAFYWMNPLVFVGLREARGEQDKACDAVALRAGFPCTAYARHLVEVARCVRARAVSPAALSFGRRSDLSDRIGVLLDRREATEVGRPRLHRVAVLATSAILVATSAWTLAATNLWICTSPG